MKTTNKTLAIAIAAALAPSSALAGSVLYDGTLPGQVLGITSAQFSNGTFTIPASHGRVVAQPGGTNNLFFSFNTFNIDAGQTALFTNDLTATYASNSFSNIISRVTGQTPSTINGTIDTTAFANAKFWFINPAGVAMGAGAKVNAPGGFRIGNADYVQFTNGERWYAIETGAVTSTLSTASVQNFGFLSNVEFDTTLTGTALNSPVPQVGGVYTINSSQGTPSASGTNLFYSFANFTLPNSTDVALFNNDLGNSYAAIVSRVTGGEPTIVNGKISVAANYTQAEFWFVNPAGVVFNSGATLDVPASFGFGAADYIHFADNKNWYVYDSNPLPLDISAISDSKPVTFGYLPNTTAGALTINAGLIMTCDTCANRVILSGGNPDPVTGYSVYIDSFSPTVGLGFGGYLLITGESVSINNSIPYVPGGVIAIAAVPDLSKLTVTDLSSYSFGNLPFVFGSTVVAPGASPQTLVSTGFGGPLGKITLSNSEMETSHDGAVGYPGDGIYLLGGAIHLTGTGQPYTAGVAGEVCQPLLCDSFGLDGGTQETNPNAGSTSLGVHIYGESLTLDHNNEIYALSKGGSSTGGPVGQSSGGIEIQLTGSLLLDGTQDAYSLPLSPSNLAGEAQFSFTGGGLGQTGIFASTEAQGSGGDITIVASDLTLRGPVAPPPPLTMSGGVATEAGGPSVPQILTESTGSGPAGNISITLTGPNAALTITGYSWLLDTNLVPHLSGGRVSADGVYTGPPDPANPGAVGHAGDISITAGSITLADGAQISASTEGVGDGGNIAIHVSGALSVTSDPTYFPVGPSASAPWYGSGILANSTAGQGYPYNGSGNGGPYGSNAGSISIDSGGNPVSPSNTVTISNSEIAANANLNSGNAGSISIVAGGNIALNGLTLVTTQVANDSTKTGGPIAIQSIGGTTTIDASTIQTQSTNASDAGSILVQGTGVLVSNQSVINADYTNTAAGTHTGGPGAIVIQATGSGTLANPTTVAATPTATAGVVQVIDSEVSSQNTNGPGGTGLIVLGQYTGATAPIVGTVATTDEVLVAGSIVTNSVVGGQSSGIVIQGGSGVWIENDSRGTGYPLQGFANNDQRTDPSQSMVASATDPTALSAGQIVITGGDQGVTLANSRINADDAITTGSSSQANIAITSNGGAITITSSHVDAQTTGTDPGGNVTVTTVAGTQNGDITITGSGLNSAAVNSNSIPALGNGGSVTVTSAGGIQVTDSDVRTLAEAASNQAGPITLNAQGGALTFTGSTANATLAGGSSTTTAADVTLQASGAVTIQGDVASGQSQILTSTTGAGSAGKIAVTGTAVQIADSTINASTSTGTGAAGTVTVAGSSSVSITAGSSITTTADSNAVATSGAVSVTSGGLVDIEGSTIQTKSTNASDAGSILVQGTGVLVSNQSVINADYTNTAAGTHTGGPGAIVIQATGSGTLANPTTVAATPTATAGVVQVIDSEVSSQNTNGPGGTGLIVLGQYTGATAPIVGTVATTDEVLVAGSIVTNSVVGGQSSGIVIQGGSGVWIENDSRGTGYPLQGFANNDQRTDPSQSMVASATDPTALSAGQIVITGGDQGVTLANSRINADDAITTGSSSQANIAITSNGGAITITSSHVDAQTTGTDPGGNVTVTTVAGTQNGDITITGSGLNSAAVNSNSIPALGNGGSVTVTSAGGIQVTDSDVRTLAEAASNQAGPITLNAQGGALTFTGSTANATLAGGSSTTTAADVTLQASGAVTIQGDVASGQSQILTSTTGAGSAGKIAVTGTAVQIADSTINASTSTGTGAAGTVTVAGSSSVSITAGSSITTTADSNAVATSGAVSVTSGGLVDIEGSTIQTKSTNASDAGSILVQGTGVLVSNQSVINADYTNTAAGTHTGGPGAIVIQATGSGTLANPTTVAATPTATAGVVQVIDSEVSSQNTNGPGGTGLIVLGQYTGATAPIVGTVATTDEVLVAGSIVTNSVVGGQSSGIVIQGGSGVWIENDSRGTGYPLQGFANNDQRTDPSQSMVASATDPTALSAGQIVITGGDQGVTLANSRINADDAITTGSSSQANIAITSNGGAITITSSHVDAQTTGTDPGGNVTVTTVAGTQNGDITITGSGLNSAAVNSNSIPALGNGGSVTVTSAGGIQVTDSDVRTLAEAASNQAGPITLNAQGGALTFTGSTANATLAGGSSTTTAADVTLQASGAVTIQGDVASGQSQILTSTTGAGSAGKIAVTGTAVQIADSTINASTSTGTGAAGTVTVAGSSSVSITAGSSITTTADSNAVATSGAVSVTSGGLVDIEGSTIQTKSTNASDAGSILVQGTGVLVGSQSLINADYTNNAAGTHTGGPGAIVIQATGSGTLANPTTVAATPTATAGVVQVIDSEVSSQNTNGPGGTGLIVLGQYTGATAPIVGTVATTDEVLVAGSIVTNNVVGGPSSGIVIQGGRGVWIENDNRGTGYALQAADTRTDVTQSAVTATSDATATSAGQIAITGGDLGVVLADSFVDANDASSSGSRADVTLTATGGPVSLTASNLTAQTTGTDTGGYITVTGTTVHMTGGTINASTTGTGTAGTVLLEATAADPSGTVSALTVDGGATVKSDASPTTATGASAGSVSLLADTGSVDVAGQSTVSTSANANAGSAGIITVRGTGVTVDNSTVQTTVADTAAGSYTAATVTIDGLTGAVQLKPGSVINTQTTGTADAGSVTVSGSSVTADNATITTASTAGGNAGPVTLTGTSGITIQNGSTISTTISNSPNKSGAVSVTSSAGLVDIEGSTIQTKSTNASDAGSILVQGTGVLVGSQSLINADYTNNAAGTHTGGPGAIVIQATGSGTLANPTTVAATPTATAGVVQVIDSEVSSQNTNGPGGTGLIVLGQYTGATAPIVGTVATTDEVLVAGSIVTNNVVGGPSSGIVIQGGRGVWIENDNRGTGYALQAADTRTDVTQSAVTATSDATATSAGQIAITGGDLGVVLADSFVDANDASSSGSRADVTLTATGGPVSLTASNLTAQTTGTDTGGYITVTGTTVHMTGGTINASTTGTGTAGTVLLEATAADPSGTVSALTVDGGATVKSDASPTTATGASAGSVSLLADTGSVDVAGQSTVSTSANANAGSAGIITVRGTGVTVDNSTVQTTVADTAAGSYTAATVTIDGLTGAVQLKPGSVINTQTTGTADAGSVTVSGSSVTADNATITTASTAGGNAGPVTLTGTSGITIQNGSTISTTISNSPNKSGAVSVTSSAGLVDIEGSTIQTKSTNASDAGSILVQGTGVLVGSQSLINADYTNNAAGTHTGGPGAIVIQATGSGTLANPTTVAATPTATAGVVQVIDSEVSSQNTNGPGGTGLIVLGQYTGATAPIVGTVATTDEVLVAGSIVTNNVVGGPSSGIVIQGGRGVWIENDNRGTGYALQAADTRTDVTQSAVTATSDATATSAGQIAITGGDLGVVLADSFVDANDASSSGSRADVTLTATGGPVSLTASNLTAQTTGTDTGGYITVTGTTVHMTGGTINASTTGTGTAGTVLLEATAADPSGTVSALTVDGGATVKSDASPTTATGASAGSVSLLADTGSVDVAGQSTVSTSANANAGSAGIITVRGTGVTVDNSTVQTTVADTAAGSYTAATVTIDGLTGAVQLKPGSVINASTLGVGPAGQINVTGASVHVTGATIDTSTTGAGSAGSVTLDATGADPSAQLAALTVDGNSTVKSDASPVALSTNANAGDVTLTAGAGGITVAQSLVSTSASANAGQAGKIAVQGDRVTVTGSTLQTTVATTAAGNSYAQASVTLDAGTGAVQMTDSVIDTRTTGVADAGSVQLSGSSVSISGGKSPTATFAGQALPTNTAVFSGTSGTGAAGSVTIGTPATTQVTVANATISAQTSGSTGVGGSISVTADNVSATGSTITTASAGAGAAGDITLTATAADPTGGAALTVTGSTLSSDASRGTSTTADAGKVTLAAQNGTAAVGGASTLITSAGSTAGAAGAISVTGDAVSVSDTTIKTVADGQVTSTPGTITLATKGSAGPLTVSGSTLDATSDGSQKAGTIDLQGAAVTVDGSTLSSRASASGAAGDISIQGTTVALSSDTATVATSGTNAAGSIIATARGADPQGGAALLVTNSSLSSDAGSGRSAVANAGSIALTSMQGTAEVDASTLSTTAGSGAGAAGEIQVQGNSVTVSNSNLSTTAGSLSASSALPGTITLTTFAGPGSAAAGPVNVSGSTLDATTTGVQQAGDIKVFGTTVALLRDTATTSTSGSGAAGSVDVQATGTDPQGSSALIVGDGSTLTSDAQSGTASSANAGHVTLTADNGSVLLGTPTGSQPTSISTSAGSTAGYVGNIVISGTSVTLDGVNLTAQTASNFDPGVLTDAISVNAPNGAVAVNGGTLSSSTFGGATASGIGINGATVSIGGGATLTALTQGTGSAGRILVSATGADPAGGSALQIGNGVTLSSDATDGKAATANAGTVTIASAGSVQVGATGGSAPATISTAAGPSAGHVGTIGITGTAVTLDGVNISATTASNVDVPKVNGVAPPAIAVTASTGAVSIVGGELSSATSGAATAAPIAIAGSTVSVTGGAKIDALTTGTGSAGDISVMATGADPQGGVALLVAGDSTLSSDASQGTASTANAGNVTLLASTGSVQVGAPTDPTTISTAAGANAGQVGSIRITGTEVTLDGALLTATTASSSAPGAAAPPNAIVVTATGGPVTINGGTLSASASGGNTAGGVSVTGTSVVIDNAATLEATTTATGNAGSVTVAATDPAGTITITGSTLNTLSGQTASGSAGNILVTTTGALALSNAVVTSASQSGSPTSAGSVGTVTLQGGSVSLTNNSRVLATSAGGNPSNTGAAGKSGNAITITSTGGKTPLVVNGSTVSTISQTVANGANIAINAGGSPILLTDALILAASRGTGNGGNITINDAGLTILTGSEISAGAAAGNGGAIYIYLVNGAPFILDSRSLVTATSDSGNNGSVTISGPHVDLNSALKVADVSAVKEPEIASNACRQDAGKSTFVREGRGGVTPGPDTYLPEGGPASAPGARTSSTVGPGSIGGAVSVPAGCP